MEQYHRIILELYAGAQERAPAEHIDHAIHLTREVLRFDSGTVIRAQFSDAGKMTVQSMHLHEQPAEKLSDRRSFKQADPTLAEALRQRGRCVSANLEEMDQDRYHDILAYARKYKVAQSLVYISGAPLSHGIDLVALWRADPKRRYQPADLRAGNLLLPHMLQSRQISERLFGGGRGNAPLLLVSDQHGCLQFADDDANLMLQAEWPEWTPPVLPPAFFRALVHSSGNSYAGRTLTARVRQQGRLLHITLSKRTGRARLTPAELSIAQAAATGASYKQIAADKGLSPATVRNQLHKVYAKLEVSNKTALAGALAAARD